MTNAMMVTLAVACASLCGCLRLMVDRCESDTDCASGQVCVEHACTTGEVNEEQPCYSSSYLPCPTGMTCVNFVCKKQQPPTICTWSGECSSSDERCLISESGGVCNASGNCATERDCEYPMVCASGTCSKRACSTDAECSPFRCVVEGSSGACNVSCSSATECTPGARCSSNRCTNTPECASVTDCLGYACIGGHCDPGFCDSYEGTGCAQGYKCTGMFECAMPCSTSDPNGCAPYICNKGSCPWHCSATLDCITGYDCVDSLCIQATCDSDAPCGGFRCIDHHCKSECKVGTDCAVGFVCNFTKCVLPN